MATETKDSLAEVVAVLSRRMSVLSERLDRLEEQVAALEGQLGWMHDATSEWKDDQEA